MKRKFLLLLAILFTFSCCTVFGCTVDSHTHDWGDWQVTTPATCVKEGLETRTCKTDGTHKETRQIAIDPNAHNIVHLTAKAATCSSTGYNEHDECSLCGYSTNKVEEPIDANAHDLTLIEEVYADCETDGVAEHYNCSLCHKNFDENMTKLEDNDLIIEKYGHSWDNGTIIAEATCKSAGSILYTCQWDDNHTYTEEIPLNPEAHVWESELTENNKKKCSLCGNEYDLYTLSSDGTKMYFGEYPQSEVKNDELIAALNKKAGSKPGGLFPASKKWIAYNYYISGKLSTYMWYQDIEHENAKYRGVCFSKYRPEWTTKPSDKSESNIDNNGYKTNTVYWFKHEPIEWRILSNENSAAFLMSEMILDSQQYYVNDEDRTIDGETIFASNYAKSDIRTWLNNDFYETAFDNFQKKIIEKTLVDNSADSVDPTDRDYLSESGCICENTEDNVFLLSYKEINGVNGFAAGNIADPAKQLKATDYAKIQGIDYMYETPFWRLRSPATKRAGQVVFYNGYSQSSSNRSAVYTTSDGVVPALNIKL